MFVAVENWCPKQPSGARQTDVYKKEKRERLELAREASNLIRSG